MVFLGFGGLCEEGWVGWIVRGKECLFRKLICECVDDLFGLVVYGIFEFLKFG